MNVHPDFSPLTDTERASVDDVAGNVSVRDGRRPTLPPVDAETGTAAAERLSGTKPDSIWHYTTGDGATAFFVARWNKPRGKEIRPLSWFQGEGWRLKAWPDGRTLYRLDEITARPEAAIIVTEGEKSADAAKGIFPKSVVTTSSGGANAVGNTDWTPLAGRRVWIWPDNDEAGRKYADAVAATLAGLGCAVCIIDAAALSAINGGESPAGWDAADAIAEGRALLDIRRDAAALAKPFEPPPRYVSFGSFEMTDGGLYVEVETGRGESRRTERKWIAMPFEILGASRDPHGRGWGKWICWKDADGKPHRQHVADSALHGDPAPLCAALADGGLRINRSEQRLLVAYLSAVHVRERVTIVKNTGWHEIDGRPMFVLPGTVIGGTESVILDATASGPYETRGTLQDWQEGIGRLASGHALSVLAISAALAGPLLYLAGQDGGGFNFYGRSSIGKTTLLRAAASVWGRGDTPGYIRAWRATANGLEGAAASATDTVLVLDELGQVEARDAGAAFYSLSNGAGKARAARDGALREPKSWRVLILSSGEVPTETKLSEDRGRKPRAGQMVRMLDIASERSFGVFDYAGDDGDASNLAKAFKAAAVSAYGTAGPEFVRRLMQEGVTGDDISKMVADFVASHVPAGSDGQVHRAAQRFGLIAVAGELATQLGVTPWREGEATAAAADALARWIEGRGGAEAAEVRQAIDQVRSMIEAHGESRFQSVDDPNAKPVSNRLGYRKGHGDKREWWVLPQMWKTEFCCGLDARHVARVLSDRGMLRRQNSGELQCVVNIGGDSRIKAYVLTAAVLDGGGNAS
jgi:uncharacterized protein (DUF927 family)